VNLRKLSAVLKLDHRTGKIRWIFSEPTGWPEKFRPLLLKPEGAIDWPWYQHCPILTPAGTLMVFNNGIWMGRPFKPLVPIADSYSRAAEFAIDENNGTVRQVWASEGPGENSVTTYAMGSVQWLPKTGNVLVCYGTSRKRATAAGPAEPWPRISEVTHTDPAEFLWEVVLSSECPQQSVAFTTFGAELVPGLTW